MSSLVFTFGTLYDDDIIKALLGSIPKNFYAVLHGYAVYRGVFSQLPQIVKDRIGSRVDPETFSFLFVKAAPKTSVVNGRVYEINLGQELILDNWEIYPDWYRKQAVTVRADNGSEHQAFIYTVNYDGEEVRNFSRVVNEPIAVIENAKAARQRTMEKFPEAFT
jgi:hypothetical protein